ncbi:hypothetical protein HDU91_006908 [Kappamyces sp. JEL0680]|nr:hypothetical protein HDU91_006908 [Kappamyces sp. JEL0680]
MHVTILLQHAWKVTPNLPNGLPATYKVPQSALLWSETEPAATADLMPPPLAAHIRITIPASIAQLVKFYNSSSKIREMQECETTVRDVLSRLEHLVLASNIPDHNRFDRVREKMRQESRKALLQKPETASTPKEPTDHKRKAASEARISVLMMTRCKSHGIRDRALLLLCEALDTNQLSSSNHELMHLQMLWVELVQLFRHVVDARTRKINRKLGSDEESDRRVMVDSHLEHLLRSLSLTLHRMDHVQDVGIPIQPSNLMEQSYGCILEDLKLVATEDPYIVVLISSIEEQVEDLQASEIREGKPKKEVALDAGVLLLSQVVRMSPPPNLCNLDGRFIEIMKDISEIKNWHLGGKLIKLLATAAYSNLDACTMFIKFIAGLEEMHWQWQFQAILLLGAIVCGSPYPNIRKTALEHGLVRFLNHEGREGHEKDADVSWITRSAAISSLSEIYQLFRTNVFGLLAREVMQQRKETEQHPMVRDLLETSKAKTPQEGYVSRISFLFQHTSIAFAETYAALESEYQYMKNYIKATEKNEKRHQLKSKSSGYKGPSRTKQPTLPTSKRSGADPHDMSTRQIHPPFQNLENLVLTVDDYHNNYKRLGFAHDSYTQLPVETAQLPPLAPSFVSTTAGIITPGQSPAAVGSHARRKLFNANIASEQPSSSPSTPSKAVKMAPVRLPVALTVEGHQ